MSPLFATVLGATLLALSRGTTGHTDWEASGDTTPSPDRPSMVEGEDVSPPLFGQGACEKAIEYLLSPSMSRSLSVANDASSALNMDAFYVMSATTGYPGQVGDYDECSKVVHFDPAPSPESTHLCLAGSMSFNSSEGLVPFGGLCLPDACGPDDLIESDFREWLAGKVYSLSFLETATETQKHFVENLHNHIELAVSMWQGLTCGTYQKPDVGHDAWTVIGGICLLLMFVIYATCKDLIEGADYPQYGDKKRQSARTMSPQRIKYGAAGDWYSLQEDHISKYLAAFSVPRNLTRLFQVGPPNELSVFDGIRVISILWVVLGHTLAVQASIGYINPEAVMPPNGLVSQWVGQLFFSARFSVDTFFYVSGFLVVYAMLNRFKSSSHEAIHASSNRSKARRLSAWLPFFYVHRLLRITPPYIFCLLVWWKLAVFLGDSPFWYRWEYFIGLCDNFWWSNLLYVNNLVPWHQGETSECFYHTWYLANDMQFYAISPLFIVLYLRNKFWGFTATAIVLCASVLAMAIGTYARGWSALTLDGAWVVKYSEETYTTPYFRIVPYIMGMMFAMFWHEKEHRFPNFRLSNLQRYMLLMLSVALFALVTFSGYSGYQNYPCPVTVTPNDYRCGSGWSKGWLALYNAGTRPVWGLALTLLCFVCFNNQGGLIQQLLAHRGWVPLARLSFCAYLLHPLVINLWFLNTTTKFHFSKLDFCMTYVCVAAVTFGSALVTDVLIESPLTKLGRYFESNLKPSTRSSKESAEFDAAEQSPGNIERHIRASLESTNGYMSPPQEEESGIMASVLMPSPQGGTGARAGNSGAGGINGVHAPPGEMAMLMTGNTNPDHRDYLTLGGRRDGEAFG